MTWAKNDSGVENPKLAVNLYPKESNSRGNDTCQRSCPVKSLLHSQATDVRYLVRMTYVDNINRERLQRWDFFVTPLSCRPLSAKNNYSSLGLLFGALLSILQCLNTHPQLLSSDCMYCSRIFSHPCSHPGFKLNIVAWQLMINGHYWVSINHAGPSD